VSDKPKPRRTGLGTDAFFKPAQHNEPEQAPPPALEDPGFQAASSPAQPAQKQAAPPDAKVKTTINLSAETLALLDALKINARKQKRKATYSDILDEAIRELARMRGVDN
jgi:hypothetical protein